MQHPQVGGRAEKARTADICRLFNDRVVAVVADQTLQNYALTPEEQQIVAGAHDSRRSEFSLGRACAQSALRRLGIGPSPLLPGPTRAPVWPRGVVGSITHCKGFCGAVVALEAELSSVGLDAEEATPLDPELRDLVCCKEELQRFAAATQRGGLDLHKLTFSAKEAFYKAYHPLTGVFLDFLDVEVAFTHESDCSGAFAPRIRTVDLPLAAKAHRFIGRWLYDGSHVFAGAALPSS